MNEDTKKVGLTKQDPKSEQKIEQGVKAAELSEQALDKVAGGGSAIANASRSNTKDN